MLFSNVWKQVFVPSCSSDSFSGHSSASDASGGLHFQGGNIIQAVLKDLETRLGAAAASLVLVGSGDAGKGVVEACDKLGKQREGRLRCIVDGGDLVPWWVEGEEEGCRERRQLEKEQQQVMPFIIRSSYNLSTGSLGRKSLQRRGEMWSFGSTLVLVSPCHIGSA